MMVVKRRGVRGGMSTSRPCTYSPCSRLLGLKKRRPGSSECKYVSRSSYERLVVGNARPLPGRRSTSTAYFPLASVCLPCGTCLSISNAQRIEGIPTTVSTVRRERMLAGGRCES
ncbi:hypothetical protein OH76DRAFT_904697 [Lentinus brumalis]|uniref:Uncharacterized protein n=1 Tax=Lentinus brumalis TaxID=2498619 RepID=A0A371D0F5_9APHY|nr:hypothetical protein OH76DRAFT_904697 [Polyporus brumalis]